MCFCLQALGKTEPGARRALQPEAGQAQRSCMLWSGLVSGTQTKVAACAAPTTGGGVGDTPSMAEGLCLDSRNCPAT